MAPRGKTENTKKQSGNAKKAEAAAQKAAAVADAEESRESSKWETGAKTANKKLEAAAEKKAALAAAKAERDKLLAEEEKNQPAKPKAAGKRTAEKKSTKGTLNLDDLEDEESGAKPKTLNASGIDNALDALDLTSQNPAEKVERHPERRFKAAYKAFEEKRLPEIEQENPGLRRNQRVEVAKEEFRKHPDNPFNQQSVAFDATREEVREVKKKNREGVEGRLAER